MAPHLNGKKLAASTVFKRITRFKARPKFQSQLMGNLPSYQMNPTKLFLNTGVVFPGSLVTLQHEGQRCLTTREPFFYLFVCCSLRAIYISEPYQHYQLMHFWSVWKESFHQRDQIHHLYSDSGTRPFGPNSEMRRTVNHQQTEEQMNHEFYDLSD